MSSTFAVYCSGKASRVIGFYSNKENFKLFLPSCVVYDGGNLDVEQKLLALFGDKTLIYRAERLNQQISITDFIYAVMKDYSCDYLLCFGDKLLQPKLVNDYWHKLINFHPSLLPAFKGIKAIDKALDYGAHFLGVTAHYIDNGVDTGDIIIQAAMLREEFDDYEDVLELIYPMIKMVFRDILGYVVTDETMKYELKNRSKTYFLSSVDRDKV